MIEKYKYVFIIGAGASIPYGFPSGSELYNYIKKETVSYIDEFMNNPPRSTKYNITEIRKEAIEFTNALKQSNGVSIDKYLNINKKFEQIGIASIISAIIKREKVNALPIYKENIEDDWYSYLFQKMIEGLNDTEKLLEIWKNKITFVTFNYDRSLEQYLYLNFYGLLKNSGIDETRIIESIKKIEILHVYGKTGILPWQADQDDNNVLVNSDGINLTVG